MCQCVNTHRFKLPVIEITVYMNIFWNLSNKFKLWILIEWIVEKGKNRKGQVVNKP